MKTCKIRRSAIDCNDEEILLAYLVICYFLVVLTDETMRLDYMPDELKKYNLNILCPIRGGIAYDYAELDFHTRDPLVYGIANICF